MSLYNGSAEKGGEGERLKSVNANTFAHVS